MTEGSERAICNTGHRGRNQAISKLVVSNAHRQRVTILCPQGRVYYAFCAEMKGQTLTNWPDIRRKMRYAVIHKNIIYILQ